MSGKASKKKSRPTVSIVGSGRLGTVLAMSLSESGYRIEAVVAKDRLRARKAAALTSDATLALRAADLALLPTSKVIILSVPDDSIAEVAQELADLTSGKVRGRVVLHTSGALSSSVLQPLAKVGFHVGSLHPLVSVSDPRRALENLQGAFYCIEGDAASARIARVIVRDLDGQSFAIPSGNKPLYHAAAVMTSGHVVALFDLAVEMMRQSGFSDLNARRVLAPLLESTVMNLSKTDPARALTGTFSRGDVSTVRRHLEAISKDGAPRALAVYRALGAQALELARRNGVDPKALEQIRELLEA